ncbi:MAG: DUF4390 domain-containing protein [Steroidobacteraceae bacterium]
MNAVQRRAAGPVRTILLVGLALLCSVGLAASAAPGRIEVRSAYVTVQGGVFLLNAFTVYPLDADIRSALDDGLTIQFELQALVKRERRLWFDAGIINVTLRRELSWHAVSERYVLRDPVLGGQQVFAALDQALAAVGSVTDWPVVVEPQLEPDGVYEISVRAGVRRGRLPDALRAIIFWSDSWNRSSEWYSWTLPR